MDISTLLNLRKNPHYRFTPEQQAQLDEYDRKSEPQEQKPVTEFGVPPTHNQEPPINERGLQKRGRRNR